MAPEKALELASQYGILNVVLILVLFFLGALVIYVIKQGREREIDQAKQNAIREERLITLLQKDLKENDERTNERHENNLKAMAKLEEADRRQREEHETIILNQKSCSDQHHNISILLESLLTKIKINQ